MFKKLLLCLSLFGCTSTAEENIEENPKQLLRPCLVAYYVTTSENNFFTADVWILNRSTPINGWTLNWLVPPGQTITTGWNAQIQQPAPLAASARNLNWNANIPTLGYVNFGFNAIAQNVPVLEPWYFSLNNKQCAVD